MNRIFLCDILIIGADSAPDEMGCTLRARFDISIHCPFKIKEKEGKKFMGLSLTDTLALVSNGYKVSEIAQVSALVSSDQENGNNIIELAKKLKFSDFTQAIDIFKGSDTTKQKTSEDDKPDEASDDQPEKEDKKDSSADDQGQEDDVDYKKLYEEEKSLRTQLQQKKQLENNAGADDKKSDYDIALQAAVDVLN